VGYIKSGFTGIAQQTVTALMTTKGYRLKEVQKENDKLKRTHEIFG